MDYRTLFISDLTSLAIYTIALCLLALFNRRIRGLQWFAIGLLVAILKTGFQSLRGLPPVGLTTMLSIPVANALNGLSFFSLYLGYRWFLLRQPLRNWLIPSAILGWIPIYFVVFERHSTWSFAISMMPVFASCLFSAGLMVRRRFQAQFSAVTQATLLFLVLQIVIAGYRTVLITRGAFHGASRVAPSDPRWLYSMLLLTFLDTGFVATYLWLYVIEVQAALRRQARTDSLTGALNRHALDLEAEREILRCRRHGVRLSLLVLDIDHFKHLNDARGHEAGDIALRSFVDLLSTRLRSHDFIARAGGEEFLVVLPETPLRIAQEIAERLRRSIETHSIAFDGLPICITASIGIAELESSDTWESLRRRGDLAMYTAKRLGRNRVAVQLDPSLLLLEKLPPHAVMQDSSPPVIL